MNFETLAAKRVDKESTSRPSPRIPPSRILAVDSLDVADLVMQIEDELGVSIELDHDVKDIKGLVAASKRRRRHDSYGYLRSDRH